LLEALDAFLARYGDRGAGEIDISRPRWRDDPSLLLRVITGGISAGQPGDHRRKHEAHAAAGEAAAARLALAAGRGLAGPVRRWAVQRLARVARIGLALREHPKYLLVQVLGLLRAEVLAAGATLASRGQIDSPSGVWHLGFPELADALADAGLDLRERVAARVAAFERDRQRKPPIVMSSDGETPILSSARGDLPAGALPGTAASSGVVEGLARVVTDPAREVLQAGEILVAPFTDPGWTPLFVHAAGVVTEVGGVMTHGAVVAREYGIPAVVSVESAVERIKTGQRIRLDGTRGFVLILEPA
jgi:pyruvate,water dikinase